MGLHYEVQRNGKLSEQIRLKGLQIVQFESSRHLNPSVSSISGVGRIPLFSIIGLSCRVIRNGPPNISQCETELLYSFVIKLG